MLLSTYTEFLSLKSKSSDRWVTLIFTFSLRRSLENKLKFVVFLWPQIWCVCNHGIPCLYLPNGSIYHGISTKWISIGIVVLWIIIYIYTPSGYLTVCHGIDGPNRNRWFTKLNSMVDLSMANCECHNQVG